MTIAYQLYCSRNFPPLDATLAMLADAGYGAVETYGGLYDDLDALRAGLDRHGLPRPQLNVWIAGRRCDAVWPHPRLIAELDGTS